MVALTINGERREVDESTAGFAMELGSRHAGSRCNRGVHARNDACGPRAQRPDVRSCDRDDGRAREILCGALICCRSPRPKILQSIDGAPLL
jgi:hypothetical protein